MRTPAPPVGTLLVAFLGAACSTTPTPIDGAPGVCAGAREFAFVGKATLRTLGFDRLWNDPDFDRPGRFWATAGPVAIAVPDGTAPRPPSRMLCVEWLDGRDTGLATMSIPEDWGPPEN